MVKNQKVPEPVFNVVFMVTAFDPAVTRPEVMRVRMKNEEWIRRLLLAEMHALSDGSLEKRILPGLEIKGYVLDITEPANEKLLERFRLFEEGRRGDRFFLPEDVIEFYDPDSESDLIVRSTDTSVPSDVRKLFFDPVSNRICVRLDENSGKFTRDVLLSLDPSVAGIKSG